MNTEKKTILVTGGAGFIGTNFIRYVLSKRHEWNIINMDALTYAGNPMNFEDVAEDKGDRYKFIQGDIRDASVLDKLFAQNDFYGVINIRRSHIVLNHFLLESDLYKKNPENPVDPVRKYLLR